MANASTPQKSSKARGAGLRLAILAGILIALNILASRFNTSLDLTRERRFTLSKATKNLLANMDDVAVVEVYLVADDLPAGFKRLRDATRERLKAFSERSATRIVYSFVNPLEGKSTPDERAAVYEDLARKGIEAMNVQMGGTPQEGYAEKLIFPYAVVRYKGREMPVNLLERRQGFSSLAVLNYSEGQLEYKFANAIHQLSRAEMPRIAYLAGHGEAFSIKTIDFLTTLAQRYQLDTVDLTDVEIPYLPATYDAVIVGGPTLRFEDKEKFKLDQYIMYGGAVLWLVDGVRASLDSLQGSEAFLAGPSDLGLDDQLFRYGVRINADLIEDVDRNLPIPIVVGAMGGRPQIEGRPWPFFPVLEAGSEHPIVANTGGVAGRFVSSVDTIGNEGVTKTILLESGQYSRVAPAPLRVNLNALKFQQRRELFNKPYRPAAVLLEGTFQSIFTDRLPPAFLQVLRESNREFRPRSEKPGRMIVIGDGDIHQNEVSREVGVLELGLWEYDGQQYANKTFLLSCLEYLTDPTSPIEARAKQLSLRLLDRDRVNRERSTWQVLNITVPLGLVIIFASAYIFFRKRRYASPQK